MLSMPPAATMALSPVRASHRPTERLLASWRWLDLDVAAGTVTSGLERLEPLFQPLYDALLPRNAHSAFAQADETRWMVFIVQEGKAGHQWWLWVFLGEDTVVFRLDPSRSHEVPEGHFPDDAAVVVMVDRYSAYKAMAQVKTGHVILAFCWAHVRRDFVKVGKGWESRRRGRWRGCGESARCTDTTTSGDARRRQRGVRGGRRRGAAGRGDDAGSGRDGVGGPETPDPLSQSAGQSSGALDRVDPVRGRPRIPLDNNASERQVRGPALGRKNYYGSGALWSGRLAATLFS